MDTFRLSRGLCLPSTWLQRPPSLLPALLSRAAAMPSLPDAWLLTIMPWSCLGEGLIGCSHGLFMEVSHQKDQDMGET